LRNRTVSAIESAVRATARCLIAAISICAWLGISNHCAIRAIAAKMETAQTGCPFHSKPAKTPSQSTGVECCKILRAVSNPPPQNLCPKIINLPHVDPAFAEFIVLAPQKIFFTSATLDTGPPGKTSFAELNWSMRAHAPPARA